MLLLLSPAKTFDYEIPLAEVPHTLPSFPEHSARLIDVLRRRSRVVQCVFEAWRGHAYRIISFNARKARGLMAHYAVMKPVETPRKLEGFNLEGYAFNAAASQPERLVFRRRMEAA